MGSARRYIVEHGLAGLSVCLHSSFRSFDGSVTPDELVDAFLDEGCTLMVPTFSWDGHAVRPPDDAVLPSRNGTIEHYISHRPGSAEPFTPASTEIDGENMGIVPTTVLRRPGRVRGNQSAAMIVRGLIKLEMERSVG